MIRDKIPIARIRASVPFLSRKAGWAGGLSISVRYAYRAGNLSGIGAAVAGFTIMMALVYPMLVKFGRTKAVYRAVPGTGAAGARNRPVGSPN